MEGVLRRALRRFRESETTIKIKFALFRGGGQGGREENCQKNAIFHGKRHDNIILNVKLLLSRNFVVMRRALRRWRSEGRKTPLCRVRPLSLRKNWANR